MASDGDGSRSTAKKACALAAENPLKSFGELKPSVLGSGLGDSFTGGERDGGDAATDSDTLPDLEDSAKRC